MPFNRKGTGDFSRLNVRAMEYAENLQAMALDNIREVFGTEEYGLNLTRGITYEEYMKALSEAEASGKRDEFEADLARKFEALLQAQAQQAAQASAQPQGAR